MARRTVSVGSVTAPNLITESRSAQARLHFTHSRAITRRRLTLDPQITGNSARARRLEMLRFSLVSSRLSPKIEQLGPYELVRRLATGGMAEVYEARPVGPPGFSKRF